MRRFTESSLQDALSGEGAVLVAFSAPWCGPCRSVADALGRIPQSLRDRVTVGLVEVDDDPGVPARYGVRGVPTTMLFKDGAVASTRIGALTERELLDWVDELV